MAEAADTAAPAQQQPARLAKATKTAGDVVVAGSAWLQQVLALLFPTNLAAKAALFALVVALLPLLPSGQSASSPKIWELPHLLLLGIIISYGVFGQKNADAADQVAADDIAKPDEAASVEAYVSQMMQGSLVFEENNDDDDGGAIKDKDDGGEHVQQAWSSRYLPDDPLVVVADTSGSGTTAINNGGTGEIEKPLLLPVRKLQPPAADESAAAAPAPAPAGDMTDGNGTEEDEEEEEEDLLLLAPKVGAGYDVVRERAAIPSPSSVLDADLTLSPPSSSPPLLPPPPPPPPPPFLGRGGRRSLLKAKARRFNGFGALSDRSPNGSLGSHGGSAGSSKQFRSRSAVQQAARRSGFDDETLGDEMVATASDSSFSSDLDDDDGTIVKEESSCEDNNGDEDEDDGSSCDEELFELATRPGPETEAETETEMEGVEDEVDRKADEFIAKFREQIRMQRVEPARR